MNPRPRTDTDHTGHDAGHHLGDDAGRSGEHDHGAAVLTGEEGSLVAEYGLLAVVAATVAAVLITWARGDVLTGFFTQLLDAARNLVIP